MDRLVWKETYRELAEEWFSALPAGTQFLGERVRLAAKEMGLPNPPISQMWGNMYRSVTRQWIKDGRLKFGVGMEKCRDPVSRARWNLVYEKC